MKDNLDWVHHDSKTFDDEKFMEEVIGRYVETNTTHVKGYTKEFVDKLIEEKDKEIERLNNIINELEKSIISKLTEFKRNKDYFIDEKDIEQLYEELNELKESGNNE